MAKLSNNVNPLNNDEMAVMEAPCGGFNPLPCYNYKEQTEFDPLKCEHGGVSIEVNPDDMLLTLSDGTLSSTISMSINDGELSLIGKDGKEITKVTIPIATLSIKDAYYDNDSKELVFELETKEGDKEIKINVSDLVDIYTAGNGLKLDGNQFSIDEEITATQENLKTIKTELNNNIDKVAASAKQLSDSVYGASGDTTDPNAIFPRIDVLEKGLLAEVKLRDQQKNAADQLFKGTVMYNVTSTSNDEIEYGHKIVLPAQDGAITGFINEGTAETPNYTNAKGAQLLNLSKWNVVDVGSKQVLLSLNAKERPTVEAADGNHKMAYLSDIEKLTDNFKTQDKEMSIGSDEHSLTFISIDTPTVKIGETVSPIALKTQLDALEKDFNNTHANVENLAGEVAALERDTIKEVLEGGGITIEKIDDSTKNGVIKIGVQETVLDMVRYADSEVRRLETDKVSWAYDAKTQTNINVLLPKEGSLIEVVEYDEDGKTPKEVANVAKVATYSLPDGREPAKTTVVELGSTKYHMTLNSKDRPQVDVGNESKQLAYLEDLESVNSVIKKNSIEIPENYTLVGRVSEIETQPIAKIKGTDTIEVGSTEMFLKINAYTDPIIVTTKDGKNRKILLEKDAITELSPQMEAFATEIDSLKKKIQALESKIQELEAKQA